MGTFAALSADPGFMSNNGISIGLGSTYDGVLGL